MVFIPSNLPIFFILVSIVDGFGRPDISPKLKQKDNKKKMDGFFVMCLCVSDRTRIASSLRTYKVSNNFRLLPPFIAQK